MPRPKQSQSKVDQILQGAMQEFLQQGYAGTSMARVAATAGVSKETLYAYFDSKEALFRAIVKHTAQQHLQQVFASEQPPADPVERLRWLVPKSVAPENLDPLRMNFYRLIVGESGRFPDLAQCYVEQFEQPGLASTTELLQAAPNPRYSDPEAAAWVISGTVMFHYLMMELLHGKADLSMSLDRLVETLIELLFQDHQSPDSD